MKVTNSAPDVRFASKKQVSFLDLFLRFSVIPKKKKKIVIEFPRSSVEHSDYSKIAKFFHN